MQSTVSSIPEGRILVTGASGYIGARLVPRLLARGYRVRCLARQSAKLLSRPWAANPRLEIVHGDVGNPRSLAEAMAGCRCAYYLVHSMLDGNANFRERDRQLALTFAQAAKLAGLERIIYLGGLGEIGDNLSEHLASRREVEAALASGQVPLTVLRAAMIIGSGSASFEILRYLVERLPVMITPKWVASQCQPIGIRNVLHYLVTCLETPATAGRILDIGGPDVLTYKEMMECMAEVLDLPKRWIITVPLPPRLSSLWIHLVTPVSHRIARPLAEGLRNRVVCRNDDAQILMPQPLLSVRAAMEAAIVAQKGIYRESAWTDAGPMPGDPAFAGGTVFIDRHQALIDATPHEVFRAVCTIGGGNGYYAADWLWRLRGAIDKMVGGPGLRRGRRQDDTMEIGETLDFWRVTHVSPDRHLRLHAEMKLPGHAYLEFELQPEKTHPGKTRLIQTARFQPRGLMGLLYWYAVMPFHHIVFDGMLDGIARTAHKLHAETPRDVVPCKALATPEP